MLSAGLLWFCATIKPSAAAATEIIPDHQFRQGFILSEPKPGKHLKYGETPGLEPGFKPTWRLLQWSSKFPIDPQPEKTNGPALVFRNAAKTITVGQKEADLLLAANSAMEYGAGSRKAGDPWVHLLVEQEFAHPPFLHALPMARFHLEARLLRSTNLHRGDYDPGVHAAQFQVFFTVQNRNDRSPGHGDFLWFGVPVYDNRDAHPPGFKSKDFGGTEKFIFTPAATNFTATSTHGGHWMVIDRDLLPLIREGLELAWSKGFLSGSTNLSDYAISGLNMGWELPGMFDVALETRNLSLTASETKK